MQNDPPPPPQERSSNPSHGLLVDEFSARAGCNLTIPSSDAEYQVTAALVALVAPFPAHQG